MREIDNIATACGISGFRYVAFATPVGGRGGAPDRALVAALDRAEADAAAILPASPREEAGRESLSVRGPLPAEPPPMATVTTPAASAAPSPLVTPAPAAPQLVAVQPKVPPQGRTFPLLTELMSAAPPAPPPDTRPVRSVAARRRAGAASAGTAN